MAQRWDLLTFLHWDFDPEVVQRLLPADLMVDTFDGRAWVGLVPFMMGVRPPGIPALPWISHFCETNVRTYVKAADGTRGVWFFSLEAARWAAVATARVTYRLPYYWASMSLERSSHDQPVGSTFTYHTQRRRPGPKGVSSSVSLGVGERLSADELGPLDHFLTARWRLYSERRAGLPAVETPPIAHWSPGVGVRIGFPRRLDVRR